MFSGLQDAKALGLTFYSFPFESLGEGATDETGTYPVRH
jgi:hypothetical protein